MTTPPSVEGCQARPYLRAPARTRRRDKGTLTVQTLSRERAARARTRLEDLLGPLRLRREEHQAPDLSAPPDVAPARGDAGAGLSIDAPKLAAWRHKQDRAWLDLDIPALEGMTTRAAARDRRMGPRLKSLLIDIENREARMTARTRRGISPGCGRSWG